MLSACLVFCKGKLVTLPSPAHNICNLECRSISQPPVHDNWGQIGVAERARRQVKNDATFCIIFTCILNTPCLSHVWNKDFYPVRIQAAEPRRHYKSERCVSPHWYCKGRCLFLDPIAFFSGPRVPIQFSPFVYLPTLVIFFPHLFPRTLLLWTQRHIFTNFFLCCGEYVWWKCMVASKWK